MFAGIPQLIKLYESADLPIKLPQFLHMQRKQDSTSSFDFQRPNNAGFNRVSKF